MKCAWNDLLAILPQRLRSDVDRLGKNNLLELRLRVHELPELVLINETQYLPGKVTEEDLACIINSGSQYSPWAASTAAHGYITVSGGHRIGLCGEAVVKNGLISGIRTISSICIRIARDFPGTAGKIKPDLGSILIIGAPGWGKTTLLRDLVRQFSQIEQVCVVDERKELFPSDFDKGQKTDILTGCPKAQGIPMLLRTMGPACIAVDEISEQKDCTAVIHASNCGVRLLATAHASSVEDYLSRTVYAPLVTHNIFQTLYILRKDKTFFTERMTA